MLSYLMTQKTAIFMSEVLMLEINNLSKSYGKKEVLKNISFTVNEGEAVGILGANGSGKSTLLTCIVEQNAKNGSHKMGYIPQENPLFDELKPIDNMKLWTKASKAEILDALNKAPLSSLGITEFLDTPVSKMSGGMKKRLSLATVLQHQPELLLMDEPFAALDLSGKQDILDYMKLHLEGKGSIIVASHDENIFQFCNRVYLLKNCCLYDTAELSASGISYADMLRS